MKNKEQTTTNIFYWSWRRFSQDFLEIKSNKRRQSAHSVVLSVATGFFIVVFAAQTLGWINSLVEQRHLLEKYQNANVLVYSNIG
jgi:hypothetical protein